ncbi:hypothetical protein F5Y11DRAFT_103275 [Daldinia sp. FL1419]|nr:hypothetical protein F5Y11DRAFT_103275 [Daldinia sp. FL1419]
MSSGDAQAQAELEKIVKESRAAHPPPLQPGQTAKVAAEAYLNRFRSKIPDGYFWDWEPFFEALVEGNILADGSGIIHPPDDDDKPGATPDRPSDHVINPKKVPKPPNSGSWEHTWYIPEWSHPNFRPDLTVSYTRGFQSIGTRDPFIKLYPALRPEDSVRNPTPWAKRFGIFPGNLNGRSRLSPTLSATRDPWEDYANQVNLLPPETRVQLAQETRAAAISSGKPVPPEGFVDKDALENLMNAQDRMTGDQLRVKMTKYLSEKYQPTSLQAEVPTTLKEFVDDLEKNYPHILDAHKTYFVKALDDQDYQRAMFNSMTTDELVNNNVYTQSDDVTCDLSGDLHPLLGRDKWLDSSARGADRWEPRYLYNLNGERKEWDVTTNDTLWSALQAPLQLLTRLLNSNHHGITELMDLRTRYKIPADQTQGHDAIPNLVGYRNWDGIIMDSNNTWDEILELHKAGYSWIDNAWRILGETLRFQINCAYIDPNESDEISAVDGVKEHKSIVYGMTQMMGEGSDASICIWIAAELIWPLLMPQFSQSEKLTAAFLVASTMLHEFGVR